MRKVALLLLFLFLFPSLGTVHAAELPLVNAIEIQGLKRIEEGAVISKISQKTGEPVSRDKTSQDIKTIFRMGYFEDVRVEMKVFEGGVKLIYVVKEKPTITRVEFQGNREIEDSELKEKTTITPGSIADTVLIQDNALKIKAFYEEKGYWLANVTPVIKKLSDEEVSLTYQINEGPKIKIRDVIIEGNKKISSRKIKKVMKTRKWWLFSFFTSSGYYESREMKKDIMNISDLYFNHGFVKAIVAEPEIALDKEKKRMTITIRIDEGAQYRISSIGVKGNSVFDDKTLRKKLTLSPGSLFRKDLLEEDIRSISSLYSEDGYALVSVTPDLTTDDKNRTVKVILNIEEGDRYRIGRIEVSGNTRTRDKVIRREIRLDEGDIYDSSKLKRSYERINNLNFFDTVEMVPKPEYDEKVVNLDIKVKERPTGFLSVGGGYSSVDKFVATIDFTQGNLFGKGQYMKLKGEFGSKSSLYEVSFRDPWLFDKPISFSTGIYKTSREYINYKKEAFGCYAGVGKSLTEYWSANLSYKFEKATISLDASVDDCITECVTDPDPECEARCISKLISEQEGTNTTSSISPSITRDTRDNYLDPSTGSRNSLNITFAGLGGTNAFIKGLIDSAWYFPLGKTTFMVRGRFGYASGLLNEKLPLYERFYVGGMYSIRGLGYGEAGPRDEETDEILGGTEELIFNTEYIFPLIEGARLKGLVFFDAGNSYEKFHNFGNLRYTTGAGIRWISPIGPIRIEWGYNLDKKPGESSSKFEFAFGSFF